MNVPTPASHARRDPAATAALAAAWSHARTLLLDMDGTLLDLRYDNRFWRVDVPVAWGARHGVAPEEAIPRVTARLDATAGTLPFYCLDHWSRELGLDLRALKAATAEGIGYLPGARRFLATARASGKRLVLVTNAHPHTLALKLERTGLDRYLDAVHSSHAFAEPKESPGFWDALQRVQPLDPARSMLVEDSLPVLATASGAGIAHLVAVSRPDSTQPPRDTRPFVAVRRVDELLPAALSSRRAE